MNVGSVYGGNCVKIVYWLERYVFSKEVALDLIIRIMAVQTMWKYQDRRPSCATECYVIRTCVILFTYAYILYAAAVDNWK